VLAGDGNFDSDVEDKDGDQQEATIKQKREAKRAGKTDGRTKVITTAKVGKLVSTKNDC